MKKHTMLLVTQPSALLAKLLFGSLPNGQEGFSVNSRSARREILSRAQAIIKFSRKTILHKLGSMP
jgi:hypothetical protein